MTNQYGQRVKVVYEVSYIYKKPTPQVQSLFVDDTLDPKNSFPAGTFDVGNPLGLKNVTWRTTPLSNATRNALKKQNPESVVRPTSVILEYHDGTTGTLSVQINRMPHTARNTPTSKPSMIKNVGDQISPADFVNLTSSDNPQYSWEGDAPTSDTP